MPVNGGSFVEELEVSGEPAVSFRGVSCCSLAAMVAGQSKNETLQREWPVRGRRSSNAIKYRMKIFESSEKLVATNSVPDDCQWLP